MIAVSVASAFAAISLLHLVWAVFGPPAGTWAVPRVPALRGQPQVTHVAAFRPSRQATLGVAAALAGLVALIAWRAAWLSLPLPGSMLTWVLDAAALLMLARAVGDFRLVGFFKPASPSAFARLDTWLYSPLCVALGFGLSSVAHG